MSFNSKKNIDKENEIRRNNISKLYFQIQIFERKNTPNLLKS